ncbi:hypothetical protein QR680_003675 [Steinernema hermaphroditum]|uniref:Uncharacterized protein n=1 Tax=Steinernema hermaphroditum TaxID=289476 RepID=A0AA39HM59_9BILA|nr:hypothetical protein QR680_003675 [Steinernema hermaphroditum]
MNTIPNLFCESVICLLPENTTLLLRDNFSCTWRNAAHRVYEKRYPDVDWQLYYDDEEEGGRRYFCRHFPKPSKYKDYPVYGKLFVSDSPPDTIRRVDGALVQKALHRVAISELEMLDTDGVEAGFESFWPRFVSKLQIDKCTFDRDSEVLTWLEKLLLCDYVQEIEVNKCKYMGRPEDSEELENALFRAATQGKSLKYVRMQNNENMLNLSFDFTRRVIEIWTKAKNPFSQDLTIFHERPSKAEERALRAKFPKGKDAMFHKTRRGYVKWRYGERYIYFCPVP